MWILSDVQVQRSWWQLDVRVEAGCVALRLITEYGEPCDWPRSLRECVWTEKRPALREPLKDLAAYTCDFICQTDASWKWAGSVVWWGVSAEGGPACQPQRLL